MIAIRTSILTNGIEIKHDVLDGEAEICLGLLFEDYQSGEPRLQEELWVSAIRHRVTSSYHYPLFNLDHLLEDLCTTNGDTE